MAENEIPIDDIMEIYARSDDMVKRAVTNIILSGGNMVAATYAGKTPMDQPLVNIDWRANPEMSILMMTLLVKIGTKRFGEVWQSSLLEQLSHL